jgi:two-component system chemotaxis response regulator CheV
MGNVQKQEILLESGTNEMEIIEFYLSSQSFGINVHKLKEIIPFDEHRLTAIPDSEESMLGTLLLRGSTIPLIDLRKHLAQRFVEEQDDEVREVVLVCEFNGRTNGFKVDGVNQIHRVNWNDVQPLAHFIDQYRPRFTGSINIDGREILIVDLEHIIAEFDPEASLDYSVELEEKPQAESVGEHRQQMRILLAEDSSLIRAGIEKVLKGAGYSDLHSFMDGEACYKEILRLKKEAEVEGKNISERLNLLITDIEMPKMDGLTLCRKVKEDPALKDVIVVLFSSLINEQMAAKCDSVGADGYATKPEIPKLVGMMDHFLFGG